MSNEELILKAGFPIDVLPGIFGKMAEATSLASQCGDDLPCISILGAVNAAIGQGLVAFNGMTEQTTPSNIFQIAVADSGTGKSRVLNRLIKPLKEFEEQIITHWKDEVQPELLAKKREINIKIKHLEEEVRKGLKKGADSKSNDKPTTVDRLKELQKERSHTSGLHR